MTLAEAVSKFESAFDLVSDDVGFRVTGVHYGRQGGDGKDWSRTPYGERYVVITNGGIKAEGDPFPALCTTEEAAIQGWLAEATSYAEGRKMLHWRERPSLEWWSAPCRRCGVYSRVCVIYSRLAVA
jgi:hypothetical protein